MAVVKNLFPDITLMISTLDTIGRRDNAQVKFDEGFAQVVRPFSDDSQAELSLKILRHLFQYRRLLPNAGTCAENPCEQCLSLHLSKVCGFINAGEPVRFILPAFPAKSPNTKKVLGKLPDMAEELALKFLENLCEEIKGIYEQGARITICSDGRVFSDLVGVSDKDVTDYGQSLKAMLDHIKARSLDTFGMDHLFEVKDYASMRYRLIARYAEPLIVIEERIRTAKEQRALFNGIHRFLFEDHIALETQKSRTQVRNECKELAYKVIQRSDAWGRLINDCFPNALRLSIHPQSPHSTKIGIQMGDTSDNWLTPWHSVAVKQCGNFKFMRRHEAEALGARPVKRKGRPSHYQIGEER